MSPLLFVRIAWRALPEWLQLQFKERARQWHEAQYYRELGA